MSDYNFPRSINLINVYTMYLGLTQLQRDTFRHPLFDNDLIACQRIDQELHEIRRLLLDRFKEELR